jgi:hypothetical protein
MNKLNKKQKNNGIKILREWNREMEKNSVSSLVDER